MTVGLHIESEEQHGVIILRLDGRLDASSSPILEKALGPYLSKKKNILLDFLKVDYLSSAGMRLLLSTSKKIKAHEGQMALSSMNEEVMEILKMAGFERILNVYPTEESAIASFEML